MSTTEGILNFGRNLRQLRRKQQLSTEEMAHLLQISPDAYAKLEDGFLPDELDVDALERLNQRFQIPYESLFRPMKID